jgi:hypothetical protein
MGLNVSAGRAQLVTERAADELEPDAPDAEADDRTEEGQAHWREQGRPERDQAKAESRLEADQEGG